MIIIRLSVELEVSNISHMLVAFLQLSRGVRSRTGGQAFSVFLPDCANNKVYREVFLD